jgi:hypothetical protein
MSWRLYASQPWSSSRLARHIASSESCPRTVGRQGICDRRVLSVIFQTSNFGREEFDGSSTFASLLAGLQINDLGGELGDKPHR